MHGVFNNLRSFRRRNFVTSRDLKHVKNVLRNRLKFDSIKDIVMSQVTTHLSLIKGDFGTVFIGGKGRWLIAIESSLRFQRYYNKITKILHYKRRNVIRFLKEFYDVIEIHDALSVSYTFLLLCYSLFHEPKFIFHSSTVRSALMRIFLTKILSFPDADATNCDRAPWPKLNFCTSIETFFKDYDYL